MPRSNPEANAAAFAPGQDDVFGRIAGKYDILCDLFSFGIHRLWKRAIAREIPGSRTIIASDLSAPMLSIASRRLHRHRDRVRFELLDMEEMPSIPSDSVDAYSISLGLKICDRKRALQEAYRVLRPGGRLILLEASNIPIGIINRAYLAYMSLCMPTLGWLATGGDSSAYRYLLDGIRGFPSAERLADEIHGCGFAEVRFRRRSAGIVAIHVATKSHGIPATDAFAALAGAG